MPARVVRRSEDMDPLDRAIAPPPDESIADKEARMVLEKEAKRISDAIDDDLDRQRTAEKRAPKPIKVLLLGTSLKFQLSH